MPAYNEEQRKLAPEILEIRVNRVERAVKKHQIEGCNNTKLSRGECFSESEDVRLTATILKVTRSKSEQKAGQSISISYSNYISGPRPACAPEPTPLLRPQQTYSTFLSKMPKGDYIPHVPGPESFGINREEAHRMLEEARRAKFLQNSLTIACILLLLGGVLIGFRYRTRLSKPFLLR